MRFGTWHIPPGRDPHLLTLLATSIYTFTLTGLNGDGKLYLLTFNTLATVLLGFRAGIFSLVTSQVGWASSGWMMINGWIALPPNAASQGGQMPLLDRHLGFPWSALQPGDSLDGPTDPRPRKIIPHANLPYQGLEKERSSLHERVEEPHPRNPTPDAPDPYRF